MNYETVKELLDYNPDTGVITWRVNRKQMKKGDAAGHLHSLGYRHIFINGKSYKAHRLAWLLSYKSFPADEIDHINGEGNDNRLCNLRSVTHQENMQNKTIYSNNVSRVPGVGWHKANRKWTAKISIKKKEIFLGIFEKWFDAVCARKAAEHEHGYHPNHGRS